MFEKIGAAVAIFLVTVGCGSIPLLLKSCAKSEVFHVITKLMMDFSAGVFLYMFFHTMSDSWALATALKEKYDFDMPIILICSFFVGSAIMRIVHAGAGHGHSSSDCETVNEDPVDAVEVTAFIPNDASELAPEKSEFSSTPATVSILEGSSNRNDFKKTEFPFCSFKVYLVLISVHSFLEGLPIGVKECDAWAVIVPMCMHKASEALSIGFLSNNSGRVLKAMLAYTFATPMGIAVGFALTTMESNFYADVALLIVHGVSNGAISFILFVELLAPHENESLRQSMKSIASSFLGLTVAICALIFTPVADHCHSHGGHGHSHK